MTPYQEDLTQKWLYLGTRCHVVCLDQASGQIRWKTKFQSSLSSTLVTLLIHTGHIFVGCYKRVACLEAASGNIFWSTELSQLGEPVALALDITVPQGRLTVAGGGHVYALDAAHGTKIWHNELKGLGLYPVCLRVPGAITAQAMPRMVQSNKTTRVDPFEDDQVG